MPQVPIPNSPPTSVSVSDAFNQSQQNANSTSGSHSGPDIYTATLQNTDYNTALAAHQQNYNNILQGYQNSVQGLNPYVQSIGSGYGGLNQQVQGLLANGQQSAEQSLADQYRQATGASRNNLISSGLGNSTASLYAQRGLEADRAKAALGIQNQYDQQRANYASQFGTGALNAQSQAMGIYGQLGTNYLSTLGGQQAPRMVYAPNVTQSTSTSSSTSGTTGGSHSASTTVPTVGSIVPGGNNEVGQNAPPTFLGISPPTLPQSPTVSYTPPTGNPFIPYVYH